MYIYTGPSSSNYSFPVSRYGTRSMTRRSCMNLELETGTYNYSTVSRSDVCKQNTRLMQLFSEEYEYLQTNKELQVLFQRNTKMVNYCMLTDQILYNQRANLEHYNATYSFTFGSH